MSAPPPTSAYRAGVSASFLLLACSTSGRRLSHLTQSCQVCRHCPATRPRWPGRAGQHIVRFLRDLDALERAIGKIRRQSAPVLFIDRLFADTEMPRLFPAATHYWRMSHGERWDLPMMEACATGLRLLAPAHSAYLEYLDASVARMIPARRVPAVIRAHDGPRPFLDAGEWWELDETAAGTALREAVTGVPTPGPRPDRSSRRSFTWRRAAERLLEVLEELHERRGRRV